MSVRLGDDLVDDKGPLTGISMEQAHSAARVVAGMCPHDEADILDALGLLHDGQIGPPDRILGGRDIANPKRIGMGSRR